MATMVPPQKNIEYIFYISLVSQTDTKLFQNNPTLASGDVKVSTDGGVLSNLDTLPAVTPASSDNVKVTVSTDEMNGDNIHIVFSDAAGAEWCDLAINIQTAAQTLDATDTVADGIQTDLSNATDGLGALKDLIDAVQSTANTISGYTDLIDDATNGLAAIKAEVEGLGGAAMVGTDGAALASSWTAALATILANFSAARIGYLDQLDFALQEAIAAIPTTMRGTDNVVLAGPTKAQMDTAHALLGTATNLGTVLTAIQNATYGLSAIRTRGDIAWITGAGSGGDATAANQLLLIKILTNKWEVTGNQLIMYDDDGTTPLYTFDLTQDGIPTEFNPDLRDPV